MMTAFFSWKNISTSFNYEMMYVEYHNNKCQLNDTLLVLKTNKAAFSPSSFFNASFAAPLDHDHCKIVIIHNILNDDDDDDDDGDTNLGFSETTALPEPCKQKF